MVETKFNERQYDGGTTLERYINSTIEWWAAEAQGPVAWSDAVRIYALAELDKVKKSERDQPSVAELLAESPEFEWPSSEGN